MNDETKKRGTLQRALIPWFVFRQALQKKLKGDPEKWLILVLRR
jgi:hypothetical protein